MRFVKHISTWISVTLLLLNCSKAEDNHHKRVPSGFTGVRGKKSVPVEAYNSENLENNNFIQQPTEDTSPIDAETPSSISYVLEKRAPSGFFGMRGKKPYNYPWYSSYPEEMYKRAPMGFVGMRGKKDASDEDDLIFEEQSKRAPMGFFGMRGKKFLIEPGYPSEKRAPMGFFGMRGKKDSENSSGFFEDKRALSGFFGMRGKKHPSGFFGMRGKKYPYEFRGKFVGVRGKKSSDIAVPTYYSQILKNDRFSDDLDLNQLMLLLTEQNGGDSSQ